MMKQSVETDIRYKPGGLPIYAQTMDMAREQNRQIYDNEEVTLICPRFPHLTECDETLTHDLEQF